jgi:hypothetical protein
LQKYFWLRKNHDCVQQAGYSSIKCPVQPELPFHVNDDDRRHHDDCEHDPLHDGGDHDRGYVNDRHDYGHDRDRGDEYVYVREHEHVWIHYDRAHVHVDEHVRDDVPENFVCRVF